MKKGKKQLISGVVLIGFFGIWTWMIQHVDVQPIGQKGTVIGFATWNGWFHRVTGVHMAIYAVTDWLGLVPILVCLVFGRIGLGQLIKRKSLFRVDRDLIFLGIYYMMVILGYLIFEKFPVNYRPVLIEGIMEASYPSSTTLLVLSVMPTLLFQVKRRITSGIIKRTIGILTVVFSTFMVIGRMICGVHWFTDIVGAAVLSTGLFLVYKATVLLLCDDE